VVRKKAANNQRQSGKQVIKRNYLEKADWRMLSVFLFPSVILVAFFSYYPSIHGIIISFQRYRTLDIYNTPFVGFQNYVNVFKLQGFWMYWGNTFKWVIGVVLAEFIIGFTCALLLQKDFFGRRLYESVIYVPWALSGFTVGVIFRWIFNVSNGIINDILLRVGLIDTQIGFLTTKEFALPSVMVAKVWTGMAFFSIIIMAALKTISKEQYESADIDGASGLRKLFFITIPNISTVLVYTTLFRFISNFGNYDLIFGMTGGGPGGASHTVTSYILTDMLRATDYGRIQAFQVLVWLFLLTCTLAFLNITRSIGKDSSE
jgi:multiple sugar transport system permease protein